MRDGRHAGYNKVNQVVDHRRSKCLHRCSTWSMSLDGYIRGSVTTNLATPVAMASAGSRLVHTPGGKFFGRLAGRAVDRRMGATGAVLVGRRTAEQIDHWKVTLTASRTRAQSRPPGSFGGELSVGDVCDDGIASAMTQAQGRPGNPATVLVHGAYTGQRALEAVCWTQLQIHQIPVLFGGGRRLFEIIARRVSNWRSFG